MGRLTNREEPNAEPPERRPPHWATWLLSRFSPPDLEDELQGDLVEMYAYWLKTVGVRAARWRYGLAVLRLIRPFTWSTNKQSKSYLQPASFHPAMIRNYLKIAWRNLVHQKVFSLINITGLSLGMLCSLLIYVWVQDEQSYDTFHLNGHQLYRVMVNSVDKNGGISNSFENSPGRLAAALKQEIPEISHAATVTWENNDRMSVGLKADTEKGRVVGADFFQMFSFPLLTGTPQTVFSEPNSLVISQRLASKYFGSSNPVGQLIRLNDKEDFVVSGIFAPVPANSSLQFDYVRSFESFAKRNPWIVADWSDYGPATVIMLRSDASLEKVEAKIRHFLHQHDKTIDDKTLSLQPYRDQYLYSRFENGIPVGGRIDYVHLFTIVALFVLLIACINFINLATARSVKRAKEIGVRKVVGAARANLIGQFMGESFLMTLVATSLAIMLAFLVLPTFNRLTGKAIDIPLNTPAFLTNVMLLTGLTTIVAGAYPALFLSSFNPIRVLKGSFSTQPGIATFRQGLVIVQFTLSLLLLSGTFIVYQQMNYIQTKNIGLNRANLLYIKLEGDLPKNYDAFKRTVLRSNAIQAITSLNTVPTDVGNATQDVIWPAKNPADKFSIWLMGASYDFVQTLHITLTEGREFSPAFRTDTAGFLLNEAAVERMHLTNPVGQPLSLWGKKGRVIGIMKNFHLQSLHRTIEPLLVYFDPQHRGNLVARVRAGQTPQALSILQKAYKDVNTNYAIRYEFADDTYQRQYKSETVIQELATYLAGLALIISGLGLFGLATFTIEQRTKEIGVRKVLGASVDNIIGLLSKDFLKLVFIALLIASPLGWYIMNQWLESFAYRIAIHWWIFALAGLLGVVITLLTLSYQSIKAALMNPVESLRSD